MSATDETQERAVVLVSGGLDSATTLAMASNEGLLCYALSFDYGQRHKSELLAAATVAKSLGTEEHRVISIDLRGIGGSALTDDNIAVPEVTDAPSDGIPVTYVPARNTLFLSYALAWAEVLQAQHIYIGVNAVDYSGYPDCRPEYIAAYQAMSALATKAGVEGHAATIHTPLINLSKAEIIRAGTRLGVDYSTTISCYSADAEGRACGHCDSCLLRATGFADAGIADPTPYQSS
jgi:7-cyano-7-deazaguanine synthase